MEPGHIEVVASRNEKIGLPNWSFCHVFASAKTSCLPADYTTAYQWLDNLVAINVAQRTEAVARSLNLWGQTSTKTLTPEQKAQVLPPASLELTSVEVVVSLKEVIGLPQKSSVDLFHSVKALAAFRSELNTLDQLTEVLNQQFAAKRSSVVAEVRPWTTAR